MALGSGISVSMGGGVGGSSGDTVHVNNQPMIVLLVPFRKKTVGCIRGWGWAGREGVHIKVFLHTCFSSSLFYGYPHAAIFYPIGS